MGPEIGNQIVERKLRLKLSLEVVNNTEELERRRNEFKKARAMTQK